MLLSSTASDKKYLFVYLLCLFYIFSPAFFYFPLSNCSTVQLNASFFNLLIKYNCFICILGLFFIFSPAFFSFSLSKCSTVQLNVSFFNLLIKNISIVYLLGLFFIYFPLLFSLYPFKLLNSPVKCFFLQP